ncbi:MAG TPA: hypothetical protein VIL46_13495 [Gemmataceae bacterium]
MTLPPDLPETLRRAWLALLGSFGAPAPAAARLFDELAGAYAGPGRHYHNLEHLAEVLAVIDELAGSCADPAAVRLAAWFHDAVYDPRRPDNEQRSAEYAVSSLRPLGVPEVSLARVAAMIRATAHTGSDPADADTAVLLDADLAILGAPAERYRRYADAVRQEYAWVPDAQYRAARARVLESFLQRPRIYRTDRLHAEREEAARRNIAAEIAQLGSGG